MDTFCYINNGEIWVKGMNISPYFMALIITMTASVIESFC